MDLSIWDILNTMLWTATVLRSGVSTRLQGFCVFADYYQEMARTMLAMKTPIVLIGLQRWNVLTEIVIVGLGARINDFNKNNMPTFR